MQNSSRSVNDLFVDWLIHARDENLSFSRETACFITDNGGMISIVTDNNPGHVEFDFFGIWETIKQASSWPEAVCMIHTHPDSINQMSTIDLNMVKGWCMALDVPILYFIVTTNDFSIYICQWKKGNGVSVKDITENYSCNGWNYMELIFDAMYGISKSPSVADQKSLSDLQDFLNRRKIEF
ncbi:MAG: hypothetical protein WC375_05580 [Methanomassiliicoccales archaeon]|jgi:proteasome lid subunit RPN8/RPN11